MATGKGRFGVLGKILKRAGKAALAHAPQIANALLPGSGAVVSGIQGLFQ
jgi:hypothetical protein